MIDEFTTIKVLEDGDEQVVRLPKGFHLSSTEVNVSRSGTGLRLEPVRKRMSAEEIAVIFAELEKYKDIPFMPEGREQPPMPDDDERLSFD